MTLTIEQFFTEMDKHPESVPLDELVDLMTRLDLSIDDVREHVKFADGCYQRNLWQCGPGYAALVLCWKPGQASPIHDHKGSACGVRVLQGHVTETTYNHNPDGSLSEDQTRVYEPGLVCGSYDIDTHVIANRDPEVNLVTLHVYTPPMTGYRVYRMDGSWEICEDSTAKKVAELVAARS